MVIRRRKRNRKRLWVLFDGVSNQTTCILSIVESGFLQKFRTSTTPSLV